MSLANALSHALRPAIPAPVLAACAEHDRPVVENILYVTLEIIPLLNLELATAEASNSQYKITIPFSVDSINVSYKELRHIVNFSPCRLENVVVGQKAGKTVLVLEVCDEKSRASFSEFDIIRISKRKR